MHPLAGSVDTTATDARLAWGAAMMAIAGLGFVGYAVIFFARNYTDSFPELGIGSNEVDVGRDEIAAFSPSLHHYIGHLHFDTLGHLGLIYADTALFLIGAVLALSALRNHEAPRP